MTNRSQERPLTVGELRKFLNTLPDNREVFVFDNRTVDFGGGHVPVTFMSDDKRAGSINLWIED